MTRRRRGRGRYLACLRWLGAALRFDPVGELAFLAMKAFALSSVYVLTGFHSPPAPRGDGGRGPGGRGPRTRSGARSDAPCNPLARRPCNPLAWRPRNPLALP